MKKYFVRLIPCIIILILVVAARYMYYISSLNTFVIPSSITEYVVGDTPASFVENKGHDTFFEGNFAYSKVDKDKYPDVEQEYRFQLQDIESVNK